MRQSAWIWSLFLTVLLVGLTAMGWVSRLALELEFAEGKARAVAAQEENVRLALWRMETALAPIVAAEASRSLARIDPNVRIPQSADSTVNGYFKIADPGEAAFFPAGTDPAWESAVRPLLSGSEVASDVPPLDEGSSPVVASLPRQTKVLMPELAKGRDAEDILYRNNERQQVLNYVEFNARSNVAQQQMAIPSAPGFSPLSLREGRAAAFWIGEELFLARRYETTNESGIVGCHLDAATLRTRLIESVKDLLPTARLEAVTEVDPAGRSLASLPLMLVPGDGPQPDATASAILPILVVAWTCLVLAFIAFGALLAGLIALGERRRTFVSSVTHELRTPLTTFRLYTEMLLAGMVKDPEQQREYLATLHSEAGRLTHLVENVLAYARVERGRRPANLTTLTLDETLAGMEARLQRRARESGLTLSITSESTAVTADSGCLEQILFNLVDNACKYASPASESRIEIHAVTERNGVAIRVRDFGPGIPANRRGGLFRPFGKSAEQAASSAPGIGLGLELSRRLARAMGGELIHDATVAPGACFVVRLRTA